MKKKKFRLNRIFIITLPAVVVLAGLILFFSARSFLKEENCGCPVLENEYSGEFKPGSKIAYFESKSISYNFQEIVSLPKNLALSEERVLGTKTDERWIEIDLSDQRLYAHEGNQIVYNFLISGGKWAPTPTGSFRVWIKLKYAKMSGGSEERGDYYYLPNVPYIMYFFKGYGIHGAYWHNNFGQPMSHGCVNLAIPDAEKLFYWASPDLTEGKNAVWATEDNPGTKVIIHQ